MQRMECERARARKLRSRASFEHASRCVSQSGVGDGDARNAGAAAPYREPVRPLGGEGGRCCGRVGAPFAAEGSLLLALLVLNRGRDVSRDRLAAQLWPESSASCRRKNFYATWSQLRSALSTPDGDCPYLIRHQNGVCIEARLLASDVLELEEVCRALLFNRPGRGGWGHLFARVEDSFADELLPGDDGCDVIDGLREDCKTAW